MPPPLPHFRSVWKMSLWTKKKKKTVPCIPHLYLGQVTQAMGLQCSYSPHLDSKSRLYWQLPEQMWNMPVQQLVVSEGLEKSAQRGFEWPLHWYTEWKVKIKSKIVTQLFESHEGNCNNKCSMFWTCNFHEFIIWHSKFPQNVEISIWNSHSSR